MAGKENPAFNHAEILEHYGVDFGIMQRTAEYLKAAGDKTAMSSEQIHELPNMAPHFTRLVVRYDLKDSDSDKSMLGSSWQSKGIMVEAVEGEPGNRGIEVFYTGSIESLAIHPADIVRMRLGGRLARSVDQGWVNLEQSREFKRFEFHFEEFREGQKSQFGIEIPDFSLDDRVRVAMLFATHRPDYRFGMGNNTGKPSTPNKQLLNVAA